VDVRFVLGELVVLHAGPLSVSSLAAGVGCSREHLSRLIRRATGRTARELLQRLRLEIAETRRQAGDKVIAACLQAGWRSRSSYYRQVRRRESEAVESATSSSGQSASSHAARVIARRGAGTFELVESDIT
jgi:AraC-like DNA-binding protein